VCRADGKQDQRWFNTRKSEWRVDADMDPFATALCVKTDIELANNP
jgi:hypothetical protein